MSCITVADVLLQMTINIVLSFPVVSLDSAWSHIYLVLCLMIQHQYDYICNLCQQATLFLYSICLIPHFFADWVCGGQWSRMLEFLTTLFTTTRQHRLHLTTFFNGGLEPQRMRQWVQAQKEARTNINSVSYRFASLQASNLMDALLISLLQLARQGILCSYHIVEACLFLEC